MTPLDLADGAISLRGLERPPDETDLHHYADWIELLAIADPEGRVAADYVAGLLRRAREDGIHVEDATAGETTSQRNDRHSQRADEAFRYVQQRDAMFDDAYPFDVVEAAGRSMLERRDDADEDPLMLLYVFLLLCSSLRYVDKSSESELGPRFERLGRLALEAYLPPRAEVYLFGTAGGPGGRYTGNLRDKLNQLAEDIREELDEDEMEKILPQDVGDAGIDLVGWLDPLDDQPGRLVIFGQAAATPAWITKQHSTGHAKMRNLFVTMSIPNVNVCVVPFCVRDAQGGWYKRRDLSDAILLDRLRILRLLSDDGDPDEYLAVIEDLVTSAAR